MKGKRLRITGVVQGVGFRPFVYNLAQSLKIKGTVKNDSSGVDIFAAGEKIDEFIQKVTQEPPPLAKIEHIDITETEIEAETFTIILSEDTGEKKVDIAVDTRTCDDCLNELMDPSDRRYLYPFINCTNCGPRYTIIKDVPYDRLFTSMAEFEMCEQCSSEYHDPGNRRFHAQPNCCASCGPQYNDIDKAVDLLQNGRIVAIKGIGGYHLACDAFNDEAVVRLRRLKDRDEKPFAVMAADTSLFKLTDNEQKLLESIERPIMLVEKNKGPAVSDRVAPSLSTIGVMLPYAPIHYVLFEKGDFTILVMTSGNRKNEPMITDNAQARLGDVADFILEHNREIVIRNDDSVIRELAGEPVFLRRSRGYAPSPVRLEYDVSGLLACGAMLKNSIAVGRGSQAYLSQYIGDLENEETYESLAFTANHLMRMFDITLEKAVCDMHPDYLSTRFAESLDVPLVRVQHHEAHARACMAENRINSAVSVVYDGVGYGHDKNAWGGEIFSVKGTALTREAHLSYMPMPGGDVCVEHPMRLAAAVLYSRGITLPHMDEVYEMIDRDVRVVYTSGMGRLFDAVSALTGICTHQTYEGQGPMMLEAAAAPLEGAGRYEGEGLDAGSILEQVYRDDSPSDIRSARLHNTLIEITAHQVLRVAEYTGEQNVCFSGGCFQNVLLLNRLIKRLEKEMKVFRHRLVPPNDGCIALGQLAAASCSKH
jgi:hydrogenase maturation protein HypF